MAGLAFIFWAIELWPFILYAKQIKKEKTLELRDAMPLNIKCEILARNAGVNIKYNARILYGSPRLMPFIIDICITTALTSIFSFGGTIGGTIGLLISNLFSILIIFVSNMSTPSKD